MLWWTLRKLRSKDPLTRKEAARALVKIGGPAAPSLVAALGSKELLTRKEAAGVLVKIGAPAVPSLVAALKDHSWSVRFDAAYALGEIGDASAVEPLIAELAANESCSAAKALGRIGDPRSVEPLKAALKSGDSYLREVAAEALARIGGDQAGQSATRRATSVKDRLLALIIIFDRDFSHKDTFVNSILTKMNARGRSYHDWMTGDTPMRTLVDPRAQDPMTFAAIATVQFRLLIKERFEIERLEHATFEGSYGISGVILSYWNRAR